MILISKAYGLIKSLEKHSNESKVLHSTEVANF